MKHPFRLLTFGYIVFFLGWALYLSFLEQGSHLIALEVQLRDPRDLVYGQYIELHTQIDELIKQFGVDTTSLENFFIHYSYQKTVNIKEKAIDIYKPDAIQLPPFDIPPRKNLREGFWIKAHWRNGVRLGIEKFLFTESRKRELTCPGRTLYVFVRILRNHQFRLVDVVCAS